VAVSTPNCSLSRQRATDSRFGSASWPFRLRQFGRLVPFAVGNFKSNSDRSHPRTEGTLVLIFFEICNFKFEICPSVTALSRIFSQLLYLTLEFGQFPRLCRRQ
jgi:hypothetical protein